VREGIEVKKRKHVALGLVLAGLTVVAPAWASFPGENGRIVFQSNRAGSPELYSMNEDATDIRRLTWNNVPDQVPRVSPDGSRIVFARTVAGIDQDIWIMNADGTGERRLTSGPARDDLPVFTEDGERVVFQRVAGPATCPCELRIVGADGAGERVVQTGPGDAANADVSSSGKLAFVGNRDGTRSVYVTNLRGGPVKRVTEGPAAFGDFRPRWSPRANDLVFMRNELGSLSSVDIWTVHQDGTALRRLTTTERVEEYPQWSPDGERIVFTVLDTGPPFGGRLHTIDADDESDDQVLPQVAEIVDSFEREGLDSSKWWQFVNGTGAGVTVTDGHAEISIAPEALEDPVSVSMGATFGSQCRAVGDFDASVRFRLLDWPFSNGVHAILGDGGLTGGIARRSESGLEDYLAFFNPVPASALTSDATGQLRLARTDSILTASYRRADQWIPLLNGPTLAVPASININLYSRNEIFSDQFVRVAFDDIRIDAAAFECPTWWRDTAPDWAAG
jgi:Tol biopolymer transport system component